MRIIVTISVLNARPVRCQFFTLANNAARGVANDERIGKGQAGRVSDLKPGSLHRRDGCRFQDHATFAHQLGAA